MATCETCGNSYDKSFKITMAGATPTFDSFEHAITALAPACSHCGCKILGHGVEAGGTMYCCAHCSRSAGSARKSDVKELRDHA
jgi:Rieske Fe-S protein